MNQDASNLIETQVLAISGVLRAARIVQDLARRGRTQSEHFRCALVSVGTVDESDAKKALGGVDSLVFGLDDLTQKQPDAFLMERVRYATALLDLARTLAKSPQTSGQIGKVLAELPDYLAGAEPDSLESIEALAGVYTSNLSDLTPKILIKGEQRFLEDLALVEKVRAILLAGVRAAYLFSQAGGRKWHLFIYRKKFAAVAAQLKSIAS
jgi:high frequency lysogenization protein